MAERVRVAAAERVAAAAGVLRRARRWWWRRPLGQARALVAAVAVGALVGGMGSAALVRGGGVAPAAVERAGWGPPMPGAVPVGPAAVVLPDDLGPWAPVPQERVEPLLDPGGPVTFDGVWALLAADGLLVTVMRSPAGSHPGVGGLVGPFDEDRVRIPWQGRTPHVAGVRAADGVREGALAAELPDGDLVLVTISGPEGRLTHDDAVAVLGTARFPGG